MAIRFTCAGCFKVHSIDNALAGKPGRCGRCGLRFVAPGSSSAPSSVFVPASQPVGNPVIDIDLADDASDFQLMARRPDRGVLKAVLIGLGVGGLVALVLLAVRDRPAALNPVAPPPVAAKAPVAPAVAAPPPVVVPEGVALTASVIFMGTLGFAMLGVPTLLPLILSRRGYLSVSRWAILAVFCAFVLVVAGFWYESEQRRDPWVRRSDLTTPLLIICGEALLGIGGCLLAAALHPKPKV